MTATVSVERATTIQRHAASSKEGTARPLKAFPKMLGLMAVASPVLQLGLLYMRPILFWLKQRVPSAALRHGRHRVTVTRACVLALARLRDLLWLKQGVILHTAHRRKVVPTRVGERCARANRPSVLVRRGVEPVHQLPRNASSVPCLSILPARHMGTPCASTLRQQVRGVINDQGGLVSKRLCTLANDLLVWAQTNLRSLKATHVLGKMNQGADMLSRNNVSSEEWTLHPLAVQKIWEVFGRGRVNLFASKDISHCPIFFTKSSDALAHEWPSLPLYALPPIALLPQVLRRVREQRHKLILIAPLWRNQLWVSELFQLLEAAPWPIPLRRDLLSQANDTLWHPRPELWALHVWPLYGSLSSSQSMS